MVCLPGDDLHMTENCFMIIDLFDYLINEYKTSVLVSNYRFELTFPKQYQL
jgi:hypothetical protein